MYGELSTLIHPLPDGWARDHGNYYYHALNLFTLPALRHLHNGRGLTLRTPSSKIDRIPIIYCSRFRDSPIIFEAPEVRVPLLNAIGEDIFKKTFKCIVGLEAKNGLAD